MEEKRKYRRIKLTGNVDLKGLKKVPGIDASVNGICVVLDKKMETGEVSEMEFTFPNMPNKCIVNAKVVWQKKTDEGYQTGFEFEKFHLTMKV